MSTYTRIIYHVVFATKHREPTLNLEHRKEFLAYSVGTLRGLQSHVFQINCQEEHIHFLSTLHQTASISGLIKAFKTSTGSWLRQHSGFPNFRHWQVGYGAFTESWSTKPRLIEYIKGQDEHHKGETFLKELQRLVEEAGLEWDDRYLP